MILVMVIAPSRAVASRDLTDHPPVDSRTTQMALSGHVARLEGVKLLRSTRRLRRQWDGCWGPPGPPGTCWSSWMPTAVPAGLAGAPPGQNSW